MLLRSIGLAILHACPGASIGAGCSAGCAMVRNGQHGVHFTCFRPLRYRAPTNEWECGGCGGLVPGELVAARRFDW